MNDAFKKTPWSISIDAADNDFAPIVGNSSLMALKFGLFDDSFMHEEHDDYNESCWSQIGTNRWKTAPGGGEISYYTSNDQKNALNPAGMITSDKILPGKTIPYQANLTNTGTKNNTIPESSKIKQTGTHLYFSGINYTINIYNFTGTKIAFTKKESFNFSGYPSGYYIVQYIGGNGETEILKILKK